MLRLYNLDPSALFFKYEAFVMSRPSGLRAKLSVLSLDTARELKKEIQREHQAKAVAVAAGSHTHSETPKTSGVGMRKGKGNMADLGGLYALQKKNTNKVLMRQFRWIVHSGKKVWWCSRSACFEWRYRAPDS